MQSSQEYSATAPARTKRCRFCNEEILLSAQKCKHCGEYLSPAARRAAGIAPVRSSKSVKVPMGESILCLLFCLPLGIVALIIALQADSKLKAGDTDGAAQSAQLARNVAAVGFIVGFIVAVWLMFGRQP